MKKPAAWRRYLRFWGSDPARDLDDELRYHLESRYDEFVRDGMSPSEARAAVAERFGNVTTVRDKCSAIDSRWERERTLMDLLQVALSDFRFALRQLRRSSALSIAAILCFALGIGANTSIFSVVDAVLFRPLPFPEADRLVLIGEELPNFGGGNYGVISAAEFSDYRALEGRIFDKTAIFESSSLALTGAGEPERLAGSAVSASIFNVLRVNAAHGRTFLPDDDRPDGPNVVVISDAIWRRRFNADTAIIGRSITLNNRAFTIIGITPPGFAFPLAGLGTAVAEFFVPYRMTPDVERIRGDNYSTYFLARLAPDVTIEQARRAAMDVARGLPQAHPGVYGSRQILADVFSLRERATGRVQDALLVLLGAVGLVLLIACINVSCLLLARTAARQREITVRRALGASPARLAQQFLAEALVLVAIGGTLGVAFAVWGSKALATRAPQALLQGFQVSVDARVLAITAGIVIVTAVIISLLPAMQQAETTLSVSLRNEGRTASGGLSRQRGRRTLVVSEIALAMIVATGAGLMVKSFFNARGVDPGFNPAGVASFRLGFTDARYRTPEQIIQAEQAMIEHLTVLAGVRDVSAATSLPMNGFSQITFSIEGRELAKRPTATNTIVFPRYFETMQIAMRTGRTFQSNEVAGTPSVAIVNETLARTFFPGENPVGKRIKWGAPTTPRDWATIVGVSADVHAATLETPVEPAVYFPAMQADTFTVARMLRGMSFIVRTDGDPQQLFNPIRRTVKAADPDLPIIQLRTVEEIVSLSVAGRRFNTALLGAFAGLALVLAAVGIYGLMAFSVVQRTREIGIRLAIGATPRDVLGLVVRQATRLAGVGVVLGLIGALLLTRLMASVLFDVSPLDPLTFTGSALLLFTIAGLASYLPARRAARIDPQSAIRAD